MQKYRVMHVYMLTSSITFVLTFKLVKVCDLETNCTEITKSLIFCEKLNICLIAHLMEPEHPLQCSQDSSACPYSNSHECSILSHPICCSAVSVSCFHSRLRHSKGTLPSSFLAIVLHAFSCIIWINTLHPFHRDSIRQGAETTEIFIKQFYLTSYYFTPLGPVFSALCPQSPSINHTFSPHFQRLSYQIIKQTPWPKFASGLYRPRNAACRRS
jgi:hypothetical protein